MAEKLVCALLLGEADDKARVEKIAESYKSCPYVSFMATRGRKLAATFFLPEKQRWWIEYVEKKPKETFGFKKAKVTFMDAVYHPKSLKLQLPRKKKKISPCGADCGADPLYEKGRCPGCPATVYSRHWP